MQDIIFTASLQKKTQKIVVTMFKVLPKDNMMAVALKLVANCAHTRYLGRSAVEVSTSTKQWTKYKKPTTKNERRRS